MMSIIPLDLGTAFTCAKSVTVMKAPILARTQLTYVESTHVSEPEHNMAVMQKSVFCQSVPSHSQHRVLSTAYAH
jgi:hypothetical protein